MPPESQSSPHAGAVFYRGRRVELGAVETVGCDDPRRVGEAGPLRDRGERGVAGDGPPVVGGREETGRVGLAGECRVAYKPVDPGVGGVGSLLGLAGAVGEVGQVVARG